ncbi:MAG: winged helix-turn-helix domain-containing protein [Proteobacteria bacterium]|nr:winged helix-turn-helix domain-containing protein [Pseudomonadota bacterium]
MLVSASPAPHIVRRRASMQTENRVFDSLARAFTNAAGAANAFREEVETMVKGKLELDIDRLSAHWDGEKIPLSLTEFWLVHALARFPGHVKNRQQLMDAANTVLDDHTITTHIKRIRHKFCELAPDFNAIETVYGMGYRWVEE